MKYTTFENIAYSFEPSPLFYDSRAVAFIRLHPDWLRIDVNENYYLVRFSELVFNNCTTVYVAYCRYNSLRSGHVFANICASSLLQDVCDYIGRI